MHMFLLSFGFEILKKIFLVQNLIKTNKQSQKSKQIIVQDHHTINIIPCMVNMFFAISRRTDVFVFKGLLSLGELSKCRVWHDNSGTLIGNASWHLESIKVEDLGKGLFFTFD